MTYEEKIASAQAKMQTLKEKMASIADKAKSAHAMKKEEIADAIAAINADLDELDSAITEDYYAYADAVDAQIDDQIATVEGDIAAAEENIRLTKERRDSKINSLKLKAQMRAEVLKEKIAERRAAKDKAAMESYILDLLDYAQCCEQVAFAAAIEADLTLLEAAEVAAEYVEKYGETEIAEAPAEEDAE